jgi:hypothetical protein
MKIKKDMKLKIEDNDVKVKMMDDGYCEYDRVGVGVLDGKVFVCDLEFVEYSDVMSENDLKSFWFVNFESVEECCVSGVKFGWCVEWKENWGYGIDDRFRMKSGEGLNDDDDNNNDYDVDSFDKWIKINEVSE